MSREVLSPVVAYQKIVGVRFLTSEMNGSHTETLYQYKEAATKREPCDALNCTNPGEFLRHTIDHDAQHFIAVNCAEHAPEDYFQLAETREAN